MSNCKHDWVGSYTDVEEYPWVYFCSNCDEINRDEITAYARDFRKRVKNSVLGEIFSIDILDNN